MPCHTRNYEILWEGSLSRHSLLRGCRQQGQDDLRGNAWIHDYTTLYIGLELSTSWILKPLSGHEILLLARRILMKNERCFLFISNMIALLPPLSEQKRYRLGSRHYSFDCHGPSYGSRNGSQEPEILVRTHVPMRVQCKELAIVASTQTNRTGQPAVISYSRTSLANIMPNSWLQAEVVSRVMLSTK